MATTREIAIDLDSLSAQDLADVAAIAAAGGVALADCDLSAPAVPVLAGLIYVTKRRHVPNLTPERCVRWAIEATVEYAGAD